MRLDYFPMPNSSPIDVVSSRSLACVVSIPLLSSPILDSPRPARGSPRHHCSSSPIPSWTSSRSLETPRPPPRSVRPPRVLGADVPYPPSARGRVLATVLRPHLATERGPCACGAGGRLGPVPPGRRRDAGLEGSGGAAEPRRDEVAFVSSSGFGHGKEQTNESVICDLWTILLSTLHSLSARLNSLYTILSAATELCPCAIYCKNDTNLKTDSQRRTIWVNCFYIEIKHSKKLTLCVNKENIFFDF